MSHAHGQGHRHEHGQGHRHEHGQSGGVMLRSRGYDLVGTLLFGGRRRRAYRELVVRSGARPGDRVLDVGCGTGYLTALLAEAVAPNGTAVGVDPSEAMVSQASESRSGAGARYLVGFAESLALEDGSFDVVTSSLALHHIDEDQRHAAAAEMARVLRPGGRVLVADFRPPSGRLGQWFVRNVVGLGMASNPVDTIAPLLAGAGLTGLSSGDAKPWLHWVSGTKPKD
jgi:ubiquinone/menaquinone biosynthesis C-methylase UbiE